LEIHVMTKKTKGALIASAVASMYAFAAHAGDAPAADKTAPAQVKCAGINACAKKGACAGKDNSCAKQNGCKGKGITMTTEKDCKAKKGTVVADSK
jgi:hypothetical protein